MERKRITSTAKGFLFSIPNVKNEQGIIPKHKLPHFEYELKNINWDNVIQMDSVNQWCDLLTETLKILFKNVPVF